MPEAGEALHMTITVPLAGKILGLSRNAAYSAATRGEIPTLKFGRRIVVPVEPLRRMLGLEALPPVPPRYDATKGSKKEAQAHAGPPLLERSAK
jgi:hypothetical protein